MFCMNTDTKHCCNNSLSYCRNSLWVTKDLKVSIVTRSLHISHLFLPHDLQEPFFFSTFALTRIFFKLLALLNPTIRILSKTFPCSLSVVNVGLFQIVHFYVSKALDDMLYQKQTGCYFLHVFFLFKTSNLKNVLALKIFPLTNCHCNLFLSTIPPVHYLVYQKRRFLLRHKVWLKGIDFLQ